MSGLNRRQFVIGSAAGAALISAGCPGYFGNSKAKIAAIDKVLQPRTDAGDVPGVGSAQVDRLAAILDRMIAYRELSTPALTREMRHAWRKLHQDYERIEREILLALPQLATTPGAMADPALASLVADLRQYR